MFRSYHFVTHCHFHDIKQWTRVYMYTRCYKFTVSRIHCPSTIIYHDVSEILGIRSHQ